MNLGQFHDRVSQAIKRGTSLDGVIPLWVAEAARILEQNYDFSWMTRSTNHTIAAGTVPISLALDPLIKAVDWVKPILTGEGSSVWYGEPLVGVEERQVTGITGGRPEGYWIEGTDGTYVLKFDSIPGTEYKFRMRSFKFTDWPVLDAATPTLLLRGQMALFAQTLVLFANEQRDPRMMDAYGSMLSGAMSNLLRSEEALKLSHQNDIHMGYTGLD